MNRLAKRTIKLQLMLDPQELELIDDWRFENRLPSRAAAIRELVRRGLKAEGAFGDEIQDRLRSGDFTVRSD
jgi:hypothetical protein